MTLWLNTTVNDVMVE